MNFCIMLLLYIFDSFSQSPIAWFLYSVVALKLAYFLTINGTLTPFCSMLSRRLNMTEPLKSFERLPVL